MVPCASTREFRWVVSELDSELLLTDEDVELDEFGDEDVDEELCFCECRLRSRLLYCWRPSKLPTAAE